jgi:hypothetical protein
VRDSVNLRFHSVQLRFELNPRCPGHECETNFASAADRLIIGNGTRIETFDMNCANALFFHCEVLFDDRFDIS